MRALLIRSIIVLLLIAVINPLVGINNRIAKAEETSEGISSTIKAEDITSRFHASKDFIESQLDGGFSLNQIYTIFVVAHMNHTTYETEKGNLYPLEVNESPEATTEVVNLLGDESTRDIRILKKNSGEENSVSSTTYSGSGLKGSKQTRLQTQSTNDLEKAPNYRTSAINQAPYSINVNGESISSLSGSLSIKNTDMTLPGRNGLSFSLERQYDSSAAQFYDLDYGANPYTYGIYNYTVTFQATMKAIVQKYDVIYKEGKYVEEDRNNDNQPDYRTDFLSLDNKTYGSYSSQTEAQNVANNISQSGQPVLKVENAYRQSSINSFDSTFAYSQDGFSGTLTKSGASFVAWGSYTEAASKPGYDKCESTKPGKYNTQGNWVQTGDMSTCPSSKFYSEGEFSGTLQKTSSTDVKLCPSTGTPNYVCTFQWRANYTGTITKPASDNRMYQQNYSGTVTRPGTSITTRYDSWNSYGDGTRWRYVYTISGSPWIANSSFESPSGTSTQLTAFFDWEFEANNFISSLPSRVGSKAYVNDSSNNYYYATTSPAPRAVMVQVGTGESVTYYNKTIPSSRDALYPIGKGWTWNLPYVEFKNGKTQVHLAPGGTYEVSGNKLVGYEWTSPSFTTDSSISVNGENSRYLLTSTDGRSRQYFSADGRILQIADAYDNTIRFHYAQNAIYNRKLLSEIIDAIGNKISITYSASEVKLTKGTQVITYAKHVEQGMEILDYVIDAAQRKTTYSYSLKNAMFNLMSGYPDRAISNPYALLKSVQHPTGAITSYTFEQDPVQRKIGPSAMNQAYRLFERKDEIKYVNGSTSTFNRQTWNYNNSDFADTYDQDTTFSTTASGLNATTYSFKKDYIDEQTPTQYYLNSVETEALGVKRKTAYEYDKKVGANAYPVATPTTVTNSDNQTSEILKAISEFDDFGNTTKYTDEYNNTSFYTYDITKHLMQTSLEPLDDSNKRYTVYSRNSQGDIINIEAFKNNASGQLLMKTNYSNFDSHGNIRTVSFLNNGKMQEKTLEYGDTYLNAFPTKQTVEVEDIDQVKSLVSTQAEYDMSTGNIKAWIDAKTKKTIYTFDNLGRPLKIKYPEGESVSVDYDDTNNTVLITDETGVKTKKTWNALGMPVEEGYFKDSQYVKKSKTGYYEYGQVAWTEDAYGHQTKFSYDKWSRPTTTLNADNTDSFISYNDAMRQITATDGERNVTIQTNDKYGRVIQLDEKPAGSDAISTVQKLSYYPVSGKLKSQADGKQKVTTFTYDAFSQLASVTNRKAETTSYQYDDLGHLIKITNPDLSTMEKKYDNLGRVIQTKNVAGKYTKLYYDPNGNLTKQVDRQGITTTYSYDTRNRLKNLVTNEGSIGYNYDDAGKRLTMTDVTGTTQYGYDPSTGWLLNTTYPDHLFTSYDYDRNGDRTELTDPFGTKTYSSYNEMNQLEKIGPSLNTNYVYYSYWNNGLLKQSDAANGIDTYQTYQGLQLKNQSHFHHLQESNALNIFEYGYDDNKNIKNITLNGTSKSFTYDNEDRVLTSSEFNEIYDYDNNGNRKTQSTDQITEVPESGFTYNSLNQLVKVERNGETVQYKYNGDGLLIERSQSEQTTRYYYDGDQIIAEAKVVSGIPQKIASYIRGNRLEVIESADDNLYYPLYNGHGDIVEIRNSQGEIENKYEYDIWGNTLSEDEKVHNIFRYSGEFWDATTNLQYLRARWYDPSFGRFINEDTYEGQIDNPLSLNLYTYVSNNPLIYVDPTGHLMASPNDPGGKYTPIPGRIGGKVHANNMGGIYFLLFTHRFENYVSDTVGAIPWIGPYIDNVAGSLSGVTDFSGSNFTNAKKILDFSDTQSTSMEVLTALSEKYGDSAKKFKGVIKFGGKLLGVLGTLSSAEDFANTYLYNSPADNVIEEDLGGLSASSKDILLAKYIYAKIYITDLIKNGNIYYRSDTKDIQYFNHWIWRNDDLKQLKDSLSKIQ